MRARAFGRDILSATYRLKHQGTPKRNCLNCITTFTKSHVLNNKSRWVKGHLKKRKWKMRDLWKGGGVIKERKPKVTIRGEYFGSRTLPSLNDYLDEIGRHPKAGGKFKADYTKPCISAIRRCLKGWKVTNPPVILHYRFFERKKGKRRDVSNIFSLCAKFFEDALQMTGTIENDNPDWIENFDTEFHWIEDEPYIEIEIEERGNKNVTERKNFEIFEDSQERDNPADSL